MIDENEIYIVGIGASAGGLEALQLFVKNLPDNLNIGYVVAQHLSPTYKSLMASLLSKETEHRVTEAKNGMKVVADHVYVCPPNKNITVFNDTIYLKDPQSGTYGPKPSIDILFESLAKSKSSRCAGIILSGTGSDGSRGIRAIKAEEGFTIAQDPESAKYDGMPLAAINTGNIDLILKPEEIGQELPEIFSGAGRSTMNVDVSETHDVLKNIYAKLLTVTGIDFSDYKLNTIQRRIERRMTALKISNTSKYNNFLQKNRDEVIALFKDILIGVTSFFRDSDGFDALKKILEGYISAKHTQQLRIWVPGCSTGEEAYSLAMLIAEILGKDLDNYKIQIFGTDIDEEATQLARKGYYPESALIDMPKNLRNKYFVPRKDQYEIIKPIREMVIFSRHDLNRDPPFLKLDLISCRNLLIYFTTKLQKRVFPLFHYALNDNGLLFLGKSETVGQFQTHFKILDKSSKIFSANYIGPKSLPMANVSYKSKDSASLIKSRSKPEPAPPTIPELMVEQINRLILPTCIVINDNMDIVYVKGENPYVTFAEGTRTDNVYRNIRTELSTELRSTLHQMLKDNIRLNKTRFQKVKLFSEIERYVRMIITRLEMDNHPPLFMICFQEESAEFMQGYIQSDAPKDERVMVLEQELNRTKEHLQTVIEELETTNEETQSLNEELQSSNEELQSSNEELETTNEELQSTNEELQTAYTELKAMYDEKEERVKLFSILQDRMERNEERLNIVLEANRIGIFDFSIPYDDNDFWDENFSLILGYDPGELPRDRKVINNWFLERIHKDSREKFEKDYKDFLEGNLTNQKSRIEYQHKNGELRWLDWIARSAERNPDNEVTRVVGMMMDVTDEVEQQNHLNQEILLQQLSSTMGGVWTWFYDSEEKRYRFSKELLKLLEMDNNDLMDDSWIEAFDNGDRQLIRDGLAQWVKGVQALHVLVSRGDMKFEIIAPVADDDSGKMAGIVRQINL